MNNATKSIEELYAMGWLANVAYEVVNVRTGNTVARASSKEGARKIRDRKDAQYGSAVHKVVMVEA